MQVIQSYRLIQLLIPFQFKLQTANTLPTANTVRIRTGLQTLLSIINIKITNTDYSDFKKNTGFIERNNYVFDSLSYHHHHHYIYHFQTSIGSLLDIMFIREGYTVLPVHFELSALQITDIITSIVTN